MNAQKVGRILNGDPNWSDSWHDIAGYAQLVARMKSGKIMHEEGRSLVWVLSQMRAMLETQALEGLEARMAALQAHAEKRHLLTYSPRSNGNGLEDADRQVGVAN